MSHERKQRRQRAIRFQRMIDVIARADGHWTDSPSTSIRRKIILDLGPHPSGHGRHISFRLEALSIEVSLEQAMSLFNGGQS